MEFAILAVAKPITIANTQKRISRAIDTTEGDTSMECLIFNVVNAMACRTPTSEISIKNNKKQTIRLPIPRDLKFGRHGGHPGSRRSTIDKFNRCRDGMMNDTVPYEKHGNRGIHGDQSARMKHLSRLSKVW